MQLEINETYSIGADLRCWVLYRKGYRNSRDGESKTEYFDEFYYPTIQTLYQAFLNKSGLLSAPETLQQLNTLLTEAHKEFIEVLKSTGFEKLNEYKQELKKVAVPEAEPKLRKKALEIKPAAKTPGKRGRPKGSKNRK